ncbi:hypothetical protein [Burkholderia stagnalis]|uniref:hypothetical protein n=1 Tax=Burkholderia stagnalis TaxID=1503054 RepID=UPI000A46D101|nr:hypothetical protein [Burkholderia stagnalis]
MYEREFIVHENRFGVGRRTHIVCIQSLPDSYVATAYQVLEGGFRVPLKLSERDVQVPADTFYRFRRLVRRELAKRAMQNLQDGDYLPASEATGSLELKISANLTGYIDRGPRSSVDNMNDWSEVFDLLQTPSLLFECNLQPRAGMPSRCTVTLISTLGGYAARVSCTISKADLLWGRQMPLISIPPRHELVDAAEFYQDRFKYREGFVREVEQAIAGGRFVPISSYSGDFEGHEDFDWTLNADLNKKQWSNGYPTPSMDDLSNWRG